MTHYRRFIVIINLVFKFAVAVFIHSQGKSENDSCVFNISQQIFELVIQRKDQNINVKYKNTCLN